MDNITTHYHWEEAEFTAWLSTTGLPRKVIRDVLSRCRRLERSLEKKLPEYFQNNESFEQLLQEINKISAAANTIKERYHTTATLRYAVRHFLRFQRETGRSGLNVEERLYFRLSYKDAGLVR